MKQKITNLDRAARASIKDAVKLAMEFWPNAHLGDNTRREDMQSAFKMIRSHTKSGNIYCGIAAVEDSAYRHEDM